MEWQEFAPSAALRDVVECYWACDGLPGRPPAQPVVLAPHPSLMAAFGQVGATAAWGGWFGVMFQPTGFFQLFGVPLAEVGSATCGRAARGFEQAFQLGVAAAATHAERVATAEALLLAQRLAAGAALPAMAAAAAEILLRHGQVRVSDVARAACLGRRQFERSFRAAVGGSPKRFAELSRLRYVFRLLRQQPLASWQDVAHACGYFDQAHFIREFRRFTGKSPKAYFEQAHPFEQAYWGR